MVQGGSRVPRIDRPVRHRVVKTYFPVGSIGVLERLSGFISVGCFASGAKPLCLSYSGFEILPNVNSDALGVSIFEILISYF